MNQQVLSRAVKNRVDRLSESLGRFQDARLFSFEMVTDSNVSVQSTRGLSDNLVDSRGYKAPIPPDMGISKDPTSIASSPVRPLVSPDLPTRIEFQMPSMRDTRDMDNRRLLKTIP